VTVVVAKSEYDVKHKRRLNYYDPKLKSSYFREERKKNEAMVALYRRSSIISGEESRCSLAHRN